MFRSDRRRLLAITIPSLVLGGLGVLPASTAFAAAPSVTSVSPNFGFECGGESVQITGSGFTGASAVDFGGTPASSYTVVSDTQINATTPPHDTQLGGEAVDVDVSTPSGSGKLAGAFTYFPEAPVVSSVNPTSGTAAGGTTVTVNGSCFVDFANVTGVAFGGNSGTDIANVTNTSLTVKTPADAAAAGKTGGRDALNVVVNTVGGSSCPSGSGCVQFTFVQPPKGTTISPSTGGQNTQVTVTSDFTSVQASCPFTAVTFGGAPATSPSGCQPAPSAGATNAWSEKWLAPAGSGQAIVVSYNCPDCASGTASPSTGNATFTYATPPEVDSVNPDAGNTAGGTSVTITGKGFGTGSTCDIQEVDFGPGNAAPMNGPAGLSWTCAPTSVALKSPSGTGLVDVQVITSQGTSQPTNADKFLYTGIAVTGVSPDGGPLAGGNTVILQGYGFSGATGVKFGSSSSSSFTVNSDTQITATAPAGAPGSVDVTVTTPQGTSGTTASDKYSYTGPPVIAQLNPTKGPASGGTSLVITGSGFFGQSGACDVTAITFASSNYSPAVINAAPGSWTCADDNHVTVPVPPDVHNPPEGTATDPATVNVTTDGGAAPQGATYTYVANPTVTSVSPASGTTAGGTTVTVNGTHFESDTSGPSCDVKTVKFGSAAADTTTIGNCKDTSFTITSPAAANSAPGPVDVTVTTNDGGTSATNPPADVYTYLANYYFTWYDKYSSPGFQGDNIHLVNPGSNPAHVTIRIPSPVAPCAIGGITLSPGTEQHFTCPSGYGGPVQITSDQPIIAGQRVQYYQTFNEVPAMPDTAATKSIQFAWYDLKSSPAFIGDNIHVINPGTSTATVTVNIPGCAAKVVMVAAGGYQVVTCGGGFGGPVTLSSDKPVLASQRVQYAQSFNEEWGQDPAKAATQLSFSWYDNASDPGFQADNIHVWYPATGNNAPATTGVTVQIPGCAPQNQTVTAQGYAIFSDCRGTGGPVTITSNQPVLASQRVQYYSSFNEVPGIANDRGAKASYFVWYDHVSNPGFRSDNVHVWNEGDTTATGTVTIPGCASATSFSIMPGQYAIATCPTGYGGPVVITSDNPVLASQRVQYYQSFNEVLADT